MLLVWRLFSPSLRRFQTSACCSEFKSNITSFPPFFFPLHPLLQGHSLKSAIFRCLVCLLPMNDQSTYSIRRLWAEEASGTGGDLAEPYVFLMQSDIRDRRLQVDPQWVSPPPPPMFNLYITLKKAEKPCVKSKNIPSGAFREACARPFSCPLADDLSADWPIKPINSICQMDREAHFSFYFYIVRQSLIFLKHSDEVDDWKMKAEKVGGWIHPTVTSFWSFLLSTWSTLVSERYHIHVPDYFFLNFKKDPFIAFPFVK